MSTDALATVAWLALGVLVVRGVGRLGGPRNGARWLLPLALAGVGVWVSHRWLVGWHLREWPVMARDFVQVCDAVGRVRDGDWSGGAWPQRTPTSAALAGWMARHVGVVDGLRISGAAGLAGVLLGLFAWGRALGGRVAGVAAAMLALGLAPLVVLPQTLHVYAPSFAAWALAAAAGTHAARTGRLLPMAATGTLAGLSLLLDGRGLPFSLAALGAAGIGIRWRTPRRAAAGLLALGLPVVLSWWAAHGLISPRTPALETQAAWFFSDVTRLDPHEAGIIWTHPGFLWGHSPPLTIPDTLATLNRLGATTRGMARHLPESGLVPPLATAGLAALGWLRFGRGRGRVWVAGAVAAAPFLASLAQALATVPHPRLLGGPSAALALAGGLGFAALAAPRRPGLWPAVAAGIWLLLPIGGAIPGLLHPDAAWRRPIEQLPDVGPLLALDPTPWPDSTVQAALDDPDCRCVLQKDLDAGQPWGGRGLDWPRPD